MARMLMASSLLFVFAVSAIAQDDKAEVKVVEVKVVEDKAAEDNKVELKTIKDKGSYSIGFQIGQQLKGGGMRPSMAALVAGLQDALKSAKPQMSLAEMSASAREYSIKSRTEQADNNKKEGEEFLAENGKKKGVVTLKSGLQYEVLKKGEGASPKATDRVMTHYHGTFVDGSVFDSSVEKGAPATFGVNGVISGWTEALQLMKVGSKWRLVVPSDLAYGIRGRDAIAPNTTLIFEVELLKIVE